MWRDNIESYSIDVQYLKQRTTDFSEGEKSVTLLIDKVYTANRIEYQNGTFIGLTEDGACAQTILAFMLQSVCQSTKIGLLSASIKTWCKHITLLVW